MISHLKFKHTRGRTIRKLSKLIMIFYIPKQNGKENKANTRKNTITYTKKETEKIINCQTKSRILSKKRKAK